MANAGTFWKEQSLGLAEEVEMPRPCCPTPPHAAQTPGQALTQSELLAARADAEGTGQAAHHAAPMQSDGALWVDSDANEAEAQNAALSSKLHSPSMRGAHTDTHASSQVGRTKDADCSGVAGNAPASQGQDQSTAAAPESCADIADKISTTSIDGTGDRGTEDGGSRGSSAGDGGGGQASIILRGIEELDSLSGDESSRSDAAGASMHLCLPCIIHFQ